MSKRRNVFQQNKQTENEILSTAKFWRSNSLPDYLIKLIKENKIDLSSAILINYEADYPGLNSDFGVILTIDRRFIEFDIDFESGNLTIDKWEDVTTKYKISNNQKGYKSTYGAIAIKVLEILNKDKI